MNYNREKNTRAHEMITTLVILAFLLFMFIKFLYF